MTTIERCGTCGLYAPDGTCPDCDPNGDAERAHLLAMAADAALFDAIEAASEQQNAEPTADEIAEREAYNRIVNYGREVREQRATRYAEALDELRETPDHEEMHASDVPVCPTCHRFPIDGATFLRFGFASGDCCDSCASDASAFWRKLSLMLNHELANFARREYGMRLSGSRKKMIAALVLTHANTTNFLAAR